MANSSVSLKLFMDTKSQKVLFAEAKKDFVDFLFNLLALPVGTVTRLLTKDSMVGSVGNLYGSIETISESFLVRPNQTKEALLRPKLSSSSCSQVPLLPDYAFVSGKSYLCSDWNNCPAYYFADDPEKSCPSCRSRMSLTLTHEGTANNDGEEEGLVKGIVNYMVMDDLVVKPISSFTILDSFNIKEIGELERREVHVDMAEGLKLLKASLQSKTVLTSVFLHGSDAHRRTEEAPPLVGRTEQAPRLSLPLPPLTKEWSIC